MNLEANNIFMCGAETLSVTEHQYHSGDWTKFFRKLISFFWGWLQAIKPSSCGLEIPAHTQELTTKIPSQWLDWLLQHWTNLETIYTKI